MIAQRCSVALTPLALSALVLAGCGHAKRATSGLADGSCNHGRSAPLTAPEVAKALRAHGVDVIGETDEGLCSAEDITFVLTKDDPQLICILRRAPIYNTAQPWRLTRGPLDEKVEFVLANAECTIYADERSEVAHGLESALRQLETILRSS